MSGSSRYGNILPYDHSRVKLSMIQGLEGSDYINANYVRGHNSDKEFVATQGPKDSTVNDFWRMVWETRTPAIVMLTKYTETREDGSINQKCYR